MCECAAFHTAGILEIAKIQWTFSPSPSRIIFPDMGQAHLNKPNKAMQQLYRESEEAWGRQDYQKSISVLELAARKEPSNPNILLLLARLHGLRYDYPAAERCIEEA